MTVQLFKHPTDCDCRYCDPESAAERMAEILAEWDAMNDGGPEMVPGEADETYRPTGPGRKGETRTVDTDSDDECLAKAMTWLASLPEKVTVEQVTRRPACAAAIYLDRYTGDFAFLVDLKAKRRYGRMSAGQAKGVLNCMRAEARKAAAAPKRAAAPKVEDDGYEAKKGDVHVVGGRYYRIHISQGTGRPYAARADIEGEAIWGDDGKLVQSAHIHWEYDRGMIFRLNESTRATAEEAAAFGHLVGRCCFCSHDIDTPESTAVGYGPVCAAKYELPWGEK